LQLILISNYIFPKLIVSLLSNLEYDYLTQIANDIQMNVLFMSYAKPSNKKMLKSCS